MAIGMYPHAIIFDNKSYQYYLVCLESKREDLIISIENRIENQSKTEVHQNFSLKSPWQADITKTEYQA